jgi:hypothetical protein
MKSSMRTALLAVIVSIVPLAAIAQVASTPKDTVATRVQLPGADCALFPAGASFARYLEDDSLVTKRFTPTRHQVAAAEKALLTVRLQEAYERPVSSYYAQYPAIIKQNLAKYQRQYYGFYNKKNQPCLYINLFYEPYVERSSKPVPYWLRALIYTHDGGPAYWHIYYNLGTRTFYNFSHNSEG